MLIWNGGEEKGRKRNEKKETRKLEETYEWEETEEEN